MHQVGLIDLGGQLVFHRGDGTPRFMDALIDGADA
jgi:hypothetical protein